MQCENSTKRTLQFKNSKSRFSQCGNLGGKGKATYKVKTGYRKMLTIEIQYKQDLAMPQSNM